jgi:predicted MFS family arabinose efflux permease
MTTRLLANSKDRLSAAAGEGSPVVVALTGLAALAVAMGIGRFAFTPVLPMMQAEMRLSVAAAGWLASANYVGYLLGALTAIWIPLAPQLVIRLALVAIGIATLGMGFTASFAAWVALRALAGIASAWVLVFVSAWCLERLTSVARPRLVSVVYAGVGSGITAAGGLCFILMRQRATSADAWIALGAVSFGATALIWRVLGRRASCATTSAPAAGRMSATWDGEGLRLVLCYGAWGFGYIIPATFLPAMAREMVRDPKVFGLAWPIFGMASAAATLGAGRLGKVVENRRLWASSHVMMAIGVILPSIFPGIVAVMCAALLVGSAFMVATMTGLQEARHVYGAGAKPLMAAMTAAFALGQILGPVAVSSFTDTGTAVDKALVAAALVLLVSAYALRSPRSVNDRETMAFDEHARASRRADHDDRTYAAPSRAAMHSTRDQHRSEGLS